MSKNSITQDALDDFLFPTVESDIPIPKSQKEAMHDLKMEEEVQVRAKTIKALSDITGDDITPDAEQMQEAEEMAKKMMKDPSLKVDYAKYPNETMAYLAGMVSQTNCMIVEELADFKLHIVNRLLQEAETGKTARDRISALKTLGEVDGVDAFKKKTEITHINKSHDELEKELLETIAKLEGKVIEGEVIEEDDAD